MKQESKAGPDNPAVRANKGFSRHGAHFSENKISKLIKILLAKITSELGKLPSAKGAFEFQTLVCIKDVAL